MHSRKVPKMESKFAMGSIAAACVGILLSGCGGGGSASDGGGSTITPGVTIAVEGAPPAAITVPGGDVVNLSATMGSYKTNIASMAWTVTPLTSGAPALVLANANCESADKRDVKGTTGFSSSVWDCATAAPAPLLSQPVQYRVTVTGKDSGGMSASASSVVTISLPGPATEEALKPVVALPESVEVNSGAAAAITCYGSPGRASLSTNLTYAWRIKSNPSALPLTLGSTSASTLEFTAPTVAAGKSAQATLECVVTDSAGASTASTVRVNVISDLESGGKPTADSSGAVNMYTGVESQLSCYGSGGATTASKGLTYQWVIKSNPSAIVMNLSGADTASVRVKPGDILSTNTSETVIMQCRVTDASNKTGTVDVTVKVNRPATTTPSTSTVIADAGISQNVTAGQVVSLNGNASRISGGGTGQVYYAWTQVSGPTVTLSGANSATPSFRTPSVTATTALRFMLTASTQMIAAGYVPKTGEVSFVDVYVGATLAPRISLPTVSQAVPGTPTSITATVEGNAEGKPVYYRWTQVSGTTVTIQTGDTATMSFFAPATTGDLVFRVQASFDPSFASASTVSSDAQFRVITP